MQAIILAAGMGTRLKDFTEHNTKCMVPVNNVSMIERILKQLDSLSLSKIIIVVGYLEDTLKDFISGLNISTPIDYYSNPLYDKTNNIYSLYIAKSVLSEDDSLLIESDLVLEDGILEDLINDPRDNIALVDKYETWMDGTGVTIDNSENITGFIPGQKINPDNMEQYYKTVNIYKLSKDFSTKWFLPFLDAYINARGRNEYYERVFGVISYIDSSVLSAKCIHSQKWYEVDTQEDLDTAENLFN